MKGIEVEYGTDKLRSIVNEKSKIKKNCYVISMDNLDITKKIKKKKVQQLKDEDGNLLWEDTDYVKPKMGFVETDEEVEIDILNNLNEWTIQEVLRAKYFSKIENVKSCSNIFFNEFIDENKFAKIKGKFNIGKRLCVGKGTFEHSIKLTNGKIFFDCEYQDEMPKIEISIDNEKWTLIKELPFEHGFRKKNISKIYLNIDCSTNLIAYSLGFNADKKIKDKHVI